MTVVYIVVVLTVCFLAAMGYVLHTRNFEIWGPAYIKQSFRKRVPVDGGPVHIMFCLVDHFEPAVGGADMALQQERVDAWMENYPESVRKHRDGDGEQPRHTFFFPQEEYVASHLDALALLKKSGIADVEVHLHHGHDTAESLREKLLQFKRTLRERHDLLHRDPVTGDPIYAFIHGNWALDNSAHDEAMCGVKGELLVLKETGCYADFTLPSVPSETQTRKINSIYYAKQTNRNKSHDVGTDVEAGVRPWGDLLIVQGPLALNWKSRKWMIFPRVENGEISGNNPPTLARADLWIRQHIHVKGQPNWVFVKTHTHGAPAHNQRALLGPSMSELRSYLETHYNDGVRYKLHYVSAWELFNIVKAAEAGMKGDPNQFRDFLQTRRSASASSSARSEQHV